MGTPPRVSVVMAARDAARTLPLAIASVLQQSMSDVELIVCDDASRDETAVVLAGIADERLRILHNDAALGPGLSRDRAIEAARGRWIAMIDADDAWHERRLERLLEATRDDERVVAFDDLMICRDVRNTLVPWRTLRGTRAFGARGGAAVDVATARYVGAERLLIKPVFATALVASGQVRHSARRFGEDTEFVLRLAAAGGQLRYLPAPLYLYRVTPGSLTARVDDLGLMRNCLEDCARGHDWPAEVRVAFAEKIAKQHTVEALHSFVRSVRARDFGGALATMVRRPTLLWLALRRLLRRLSSNCHGPKDGCAGKGGSNGRP